MTFAVSPDGQVEYLMKAGKDVVKSRTLEGNVRRMIEQATPTSLSRRSLLPSEEVQGKRGNCYV